uniref:Uncharacterized protein n=1 Tax=Panagrolaimus sp. ES5 TaxID=591445 RepID=A0AC34F2Y1_9BILA
MSGTIKPLGSNLLKMKPKKFFTKYKSPISSLDFSADGTKLITTAENNHISLYDVLKGDTVKIINSKVYGAGFVLFGAHPETIVVSSTLKDHTVRYMSLYDNKCIRVFSGHTGRITNMKLSPIRDVLITCSDDKTVRLWDIRQNECTHKMDAGTIGAVASVDPEGLVAAIGLDSTTIKLFDFRNMGDGPFQTFPFDDPPTRTWTNIKFSPLGNYIMVNTNTPAVILVDAFQAELNYTLNYNLNRGMAEEEGNFFSDFSSDEKFLFTGCPNGVVSIYECSDATHYADLKSQHRGHVTHAVFNPKYCVMATASDELRFRFNGGLDCPDWVLAEISAFSTIPNDFFNNCCKLIIDRLHKNIKSFTDVDLENWNKGQFEDLRLMKGAIASLTFIIEKSTKYECDPEDLEKEMLQLGMSTDHARDLSEIYSHCFKDLHDILVKRFPREPSLTIIDSSLQQIGDAKVHTLHVKTSEGKPLNFAIEHGQFHQLKEG